MALTVTPLSIDSAMAVLRLRSGTRKTLDVATLVDLNLQLVPRGKLKEYGSFSYDHRSLLLQPQTTIKVRQRKVQVRIIAEYIDALVNDSVDSILITDVPNDGSLYHLNGLHRLTAARLLHLPIVADFWV